MEDVQFDVQRRSTHDCQLFREEECGRLPEGLFRFSFVYLLYLRRLHEDRRREKVKLKVKDVVCYDDDDDGDGG